MLVTAATDLQKDIVESGRVGRGGDRIYSTDLVEVPYSSLFFTGSWLCERLLRQEFLLD